MQVSTLVSEESYNANANGHSDTLNSSQACTMYKFQKLDSTVFLSHSVHDHTYAIYDNVGRVLHRLPTKSDKGIAEE